MFKRPVQQLCHQFSMQVNFFFATQKMMFMFGAPGVGKGTYAVKLAKDLKLNHISTGECIRKILKGKASASFDRSLISQIKSVIQAGGLVGDDIVLGILKEQLKEPASENGVIMDGFPRTLKQLEMYDEEGYPSHLVINITVDQDVLIQRLLGRVTCEKCGAGYNVAEIDKEGYPPNPLKPKEDGICDKCGGRLVKRADDKEEVIRHRMVEYEKNTQPILNIFNSRGIVYNHENRSLDDYPTLLEKCKEALNKI